MVTAQRLEADLRSRLDELAAQTQTPGYVLGMYHDGGTVSVAVGRANANTNATMTADTAFLLGSVTKVVTATLLMRFVERGIVDLDVPVTRYLPDLRLGDPDALPSLRVRHLLNHTSGIDADSYAPEYGRGDDAIARYVADLRRFGQVHPIGEQVSYCNPGFVLAGRILEVVTGDTFDRLLKREVFEAAEMDRACTSGDEAVLHRTAVGHFIDSDTGRLRTTKRFMLPYCAAPAGATPIVTVGDMLRFARIHLDRGLAEHGSRVLSNESVRVMQKSTVRVAAPNVYPIGLGWMLPPYREERVLWHGGGSFGGLTHFVVLPEHDFAFIAFGNGRGAAIMHDALTQLLLQEYLRLPPPARPTRTAGEVTAERYLGTYRQFQLATIIDQDSEGGLVARAEMQDLSEDAKTLYAEWNGGVEDMPTVPLEPLTERWFVPRGSPLEALNGIWTRAQTVSFLDPDASGRFRYRHTGFRIARRHG